MQVGGGEGQGFLQKQNLPGGMGAVVDSRSSFSSPFACLELPGQVCECDTSTLLRFSSSPAQLIQDPKSVVSQISAGFIRI